jgi:hypothetical protein
MAKETFPARVAAEGVNSKDTITWLDTPVFELNDYTLTVETHGAVYPSTIALRRLNKTLKSLGVTSIHKLWSLTMTDLASTEGVGIRQVIAAASILEHCERDVMNWLNDHGKTVESRARAAVARGKKRKAGKRTYRKKAS